MTSAHEAQGRVILARRAQVLRMIWEQGPLSLGQIRAEFPDDLFPLEVPEHLVSLSTSGLIHMDTGPIDPLYGPELSQEAEAKRAYGLLAGTRQCERCGCSDDWGCAEGCDWAGPALCSACTDTAEVTA